MNTRSPPLAGTHTLRNQRRDFFEWHRGRAPYVFWALDLDFPEVGQRVAEAARHLDGLLLDGYRRQPHVTLELCGFPAAVPVADDEFPPSRLESQCRALQRVRVPAFGIEAQMMWKRKRQLNWGTIRIIQTFGTAHQASRSPGKWTPVHDTRKIVENRKRSFSD